MLDNMLAVTFNVISCSFYARHHMLNVVLNSMLHPSLDSMHGSFLDSMPISMLDTFSHLSTMEKYIFRMGLPSAAWEMYAILLSHVLFGWNTMRGYIYIYIHPSIANLPIPTSTMQTCAGETIILCHKLDELHVLT
jgi:hypothetical protein